MSEVEIRYTLCISKNESIEITEEEAKSLYNKLHALFKEKVDWMPVTYPVYPSQPYYTSPSVPDPYIPQYPYVTCEVAGSSGTADLTNITTY